VGADPQGALRDGTAGGNRCCNILTAVIALAGAKSVKITIPGGTRSTQDARIADGVDSGTQAQTYVHNLIMGKRYISHRGPFFVKSMATGETIEAEIRESFLGTIFGRRTHQVSHLQHGLAHMATLFVCWGGRGVSLCAVSGACCKSCVPGCVSCYSSRQDVLAGQETVTYLRRGGG